MRCEYCSRYNEAESDQPDLASIRIEVAKQNGWYAFYDHARRVVLYFCQGQCESKHKTAARVKVIGIVSR